MKDISNPYRKKLRAIAEVQYSAIPAIFDKRGSIISAIHPEIVDKYPHWQTDLGSITFLDSLSQPCTEFQISLKKTSIIIEDPGSMQEFVDRAMKYLGLVHGQIGSDIKKLHRFGVRLVEIFVSQSTDTFPETLSKLTSTFLRVPTDLTVKTTDIMVNVIHEKGMYYIGPIKRGEAWVQQMFKFPERNVPNVGIGIDIDSYVTDIVINKRDDLLKTFQSVYDLSKAVEESLLRHQGIFDGK